MILFGSLLAVSSPKNTKTAWTKKKQILIVLACLYIYNIHDISGVKTSRY